MQETREAETAPLDKAVAAWLGWVRNRRSRSEQTWEGYGRMLRDFRLYLHRHGRDLDPYQGLPVTATEAERRTAINTFADLIQEFLTVSPWGHRRAASSYNRAWSALKSFYAFAIRRDYLFCANPVDKVDRVSQQAYRSSRALNLDTVAKAMRAIDRTSLIGARDFALLSVFLETGRRASEVLGLRWGNVIQRADGRVEVIFERTKGGILRRNVLTVETSSALVTWVQRAYEPTRPQADSTLWPTLGHTARARGLYRTLCRVDAGQVCKRHLGTTSLHRLRHTFALAMKQAGASLEDIKVALGHRSIATTEIYIRSLEAPENQYAGQVGALLGII